MDIYFWFFSLVYGSIKHRMIEAIHSQITVRLTIKLLSGEAIERNLENETGYQPYFSSADSHGVALVCPASHKSSTSYHTKSPTREIHTSQRSAGYPARRPQITRCPRQSMVLRRIEERTDRQVGLRASFRAYDVPGFEDRR